MDNFQPQEQPVMPAETTQFNPSPAEPQQEPQPEKGGMVKMILIAVVAAIIFLAVGVLAGYYFSTRISPQETVSPAVNQPTTTEAIVPAPIVPEITWQAPQAIKLSKSLVTSIPAGLVEEKVAPIYSIGTFAAGQYQGAELILVIAYPNSPASWPGYFRFVKQGDNLIFLRKNSDAMDETYQFISSAFTVDNNYEIMELISPAQIVGPQGEILQRDDYAKEFFSPNNLRLAFTDPTYGNIYTTIYNVGQLQPKTALDRNGFYLKMPDGTTAVYKLTADMLDESVAPKITWADGKANAQTYSHSDRNGCGTTNYVSLVETSALKLVEIGHTPKGESIMAPVDTNNSYYKDLYNNKYQVFDDQKKVSYSAFIASRPLFFWTDSFGRMIKFESTKYQPLAECGKPVIYLYPQKKTNVSVKVAPEGGFSYTDPEYNGGWNVTAEPSGQLTEISSGKKYPYLFWEGRGGIYNTPTLGFTVKRAEVKSFLTEKLSLYHLNQKEINDFLEFWLPRMQEKPYYFVTFLGTAEMDRLAPLTITPKPDTIIRVLMDFTPLDRAVPSVGYDIKAPERNGFTVIEWGGVIRK